jgi:hypothetical protein
VIIDLERYARLAEVARVSENDSLHQHLDKVEPPSGDDRRSRARRASRRPGDQPGSARSHRDSGRR